MNRITGIIVFVAGILIAVLGILKIVYGVTGTGVVLILTGALVFGLSFVPKPSDAETPQMSVFESLTKIFYAPTEVFQNLRSHPRWLVALLIMSVLSSVYLNLFYYKVTPEKIINYTTEKTLQMPMLANNEEAKKQIEAQRPQQIEDNKNPVLRGAQSVATTAGNIFLYAFISAIFFLFILALGGKMNYWQTFAATVYAFFPIAVIRFILNTVVLFSKDADDIHPILGQSSLIQDNLGFLVTPADNPVLYVLLASFSILMFVWIWLNATGLQNTGEKVSSTSAWTASIAIYLVMVTFGVVMALMFPSFIS